jgi:hypothetical protein
MGGREANDRPTNQGKPFPRGSSSHHALTGRYTLHDHMGQQQRATGRAARTALCKTNKNKRDKSLEPCWPPCTLPPLHPRHGNVARHAFTQKVGGLREGIWKMCETAHEEHATLFLQPLPANPSGANHHTGCKRSGVSCLGIGGEGQRRARQRREGCGGGGPYPREEETEGARGSPLGRQCST